MSISLDHSITVEFNDQSLIDLGSIIETTGLYLHSSVECNLVQHTCYIFNVAQTAPGRYVIQARAPHPQSEGSYDKFAIDHAFAVLYLLAYGWAASGANVTIEGPWQDFLPCRGRLSFERTEIARPHPLFQDGLPPASRATYPSFETLSEIYATLPFDAQWSEVKGSLMFIELFQESSPKAKSPNQVRLKHHTGLQVDLLLRSGRIHSHQLEHIQLEVQPEYASFGCARHVANARTWWDACIDHCPSQGIELVRFSILPSEIAILSVEKIYRYHLDDDSTLERPECIDFGPGFHRTRSIDSWLGSARIFGEAKRTKEAIACCEQAIATAKAIQSGLSNISISLPPGTSAQQLLDDAEIEFLRWQEFSEALRNPVRAHDRWNDKVKSGGIHELSKCVGECWQTAIDDLVEAINYAHYDSEDYHHKVQSIRCFTWLMKGDPGSLRYERLFGSDLMRAKVPKASLAAMGYNFSTEVIPSHLEFEDIFTLTLGRFKFWGSTEHRVLISCAEPNHIYRI